MAFAATTEWDVRTTGDDTNGGGFDKASTGTDRSISDSPYQTYSDLAIDGATNTKMTSSAHPFGSADVGNIVNITTSTGGWTAQRVQIVSVTSAVATCDKPLGTVGSINGAGKLGGGLATIGAANGLMVTGNILHIKAGTYTLTASIVTTNIAFAWVGYNTSHNDGGTKPLITTATNSTDLITTQSTSEVRFENISFSNTAGTRANCFAARTRANTWWIINDCILDGFTTALGADNTGSNYSVSKIFLRNTEIKNCSAWGIFTYSGYTQLESCWVHDCTTGGIKTSAISQLYLQYSVVSACGTGLDVTADGSNGGVVLVNSAIANNTSYGLVMGTGTIYARLVNSILYGNPSNKDIYVSGTWGGLARSLKASRNNAYGGTTNWGTSTGDVVLSANPFTSTTDFTLNSTIGGGAACKGTGFPGLTLFGSGSSDIGVFQTGTSVADYPSENDVRDAVSYGSGAYTGNVVLPAESNVLSGVDYGANGTEFTGTASTGGGAYTFIS